MSRNRGKIISGRSREIIFSVDKYLTEEKNVCNNLLKSLLSVDQNAMCTDSNVVVPKELFDEIVEFFKVKSTKLTKRVEAATGVNKNTITRIRGEGKIAAENTGRLRTPTWQRRGRKIRLDNFDLCAIKNIIMNLCKDNERLTVNKILARAKADINFPGKKTTMVRILKDELGYCFKTCNQKRLDLVEQPQVRAWRARYLRRMHENDSLGPNKKPIIYVGSMWLHCNFSDNNKRTDLGIQKSDSIGNILIIIHAGYEKGFFRNAEAVWKVNSKIKDYRRQINCKKFLQWISNKLLPNLSPNCIIVVDSSLCSSAVTKPPTLRTNTDTMKKWLSENNIPYQEHYTKIELFELIIKNQPVDGSLIDNLLKSHGHELLLLPPYSWDLNPIETIWDVVKQRIEEKNEPESEIEDLALEALQSITENDWRLQMNHTKRKEEQYWRREHLDNDSQPEIIVNTGDEKSEENSCEDSDGSVESDSELLLCDIDKQL